MLFRSTAWLLWLTTVSTAVTALDLSATSSAGRTLLSKARALNENENNADDAFLAEYSLKFQGCHHVQQWNDNADEEDDVRIMTKRLARFRLCPTDQCSNDRSAGCNSKFGDYVVDMDSFVEAYLEAMEAEKEELCGQAQEDCEAECNNQDDDCMAQCYYAMELDYCAEEDNNNNNNDGDENGFDAKEYAACQQFDMPEGYNNNDDANNNANNNNRQLEDQAEEYFIGAFCADQGGEIHLGLFTDDTCTTFASNGYSMFLNAMGYSMPYSESSLVTGRCLSCGTNNNDNGYDYYESKGVCEDTYALSGKCETRMSIDYPNESSCNYIEGIKIIREDGVIRTSATKKSKAAAVSIGLFSTLAVLMASYVYYLRTKLARAQINLAASAQPLT